MILIGWLDEVKRLKASGMGSDFPSWESLGYREISEYLDKGVPWEETVERIKQNTRRFAKRQITWFRKDGRISWISVQEPVDWPKIADDILRSYKTGN
jgi:tRNA dimethylallyltransferase